MPVTLRKVTQENWRSVARLEVAEDQRHFVAPNVYSLAEAAYDPGLTPVAVYAGETLVGFALYTHEPFPGDWTFTRTSYQGELGILRLMVDKQYQGKGYGRQAMQILIEQMRQLPGGHAIILNFAPANEGARRLYERLGFVIYEQDEESCWTRLITPAASSPTTPVR